jgi:hypothetical protein
MIPSSLAPKVLARYTRQWQPETYLRTTPWAHRATPLGTGFGNTRFASPHDSFKLLYIAKDLPASVAEAIVRDRFEGAAIREMMRSEFSDWGVCEVSATAPLRLLDLRGNACFDLGISTDIVGAKAHDEARAFSQILYDSTDLDGILYTSRLRRRTPCIAIYERAVKSLRADPVVELETLAALVRALRSLNIDLITHPTGGS